MTTKSVSRMSEEGAVGAINDICNGLIHFFEENEGAKFFLESLIENTLDPLAAEDFFGTEGWEHGLGLEDE